MLGTLVACLLLCWPAPGDGPAAAAAVEMKRHAGPMEKVLAEAKASNRIVLLDLFTEPSPPCQQMRREVFTDPTVAAYANANLLFYAVDGEKGEGVALVEKYGVQAYPQFVFLGPDGAEIERKAGGMEADDFLVLLGDVKSGNTLAAVKARLEKSPADVEALVIRGRWLLGEEGGEEEAFGHFRKALELDPKDAKPATIEARYWLCQQEVHEAQSLDPVKEFAKKYPSSRFALKVHHFVAMVLGMTGDDFGASESLEVLDRRGVLTPGEKNAYAWYLATHGKELEKALGLVEAALATEPDAAAYLDTKAECLSRLGRHEEAVTWQKKAVEKAVERAKPAYRERLARFERKRDAAKKAAEPAGGATEEPKDGAK